MKKKKSLKLNRYASVSNRELWNLDHTICEFMIPRLKRFKEINIAYPGREPYDTPEKWDEAIDKMILAFELAKQDPIDLYHEEFHRDYENEFLQKIGEHHRKIREGLLIFAECFEDLWI